MKSAVLAGLCFALVAAPAQTLYVATPLGFLPQGFETAGVAMNMSAQVVGSMAATVGTPPVGTYRTPFLYNNGVLTALAPDYPNLQVARGINNSGQIVGECASSHACIYAGGVIKDLGTLSGPSGFSGGLGINNSGEVTGYSSSSVNGPALAHAFIYRSGQMTDLGTLPGEITSGGHAINDSGQVTGDSGRKVYLYTNGSMLDLGISGQGLAVNNAGEVVGEFDVGFNTHAFLYSGGIVHELGAFPGGSDTPSGAEGINNSGQIVGYASAGASSPNSHAFVYYKQVMTDLNTVVVNSLNGYTLINAHAINDFGQILAIGTQPGTLVFLTESFLLTPLTRLRFVPVPPCRVADTRNPAGPFGGPEILGGSTRDFTISSSACGIPSTAIAYSLNATVIPDAQLGYLTIWPSGIAQPLVSTLNSDGRVKANAAIVRSGYNGAITVFASDPTQLVIDINGYFEEDNTSPSDLQFYPLAPCRAADTRQSPGAFGAPFLEGGGTRSFPIASSACNVPAAAQAYSLNVTAVPHGPLGYLTVWPAGQPQPLVSTLNASTGSITANAAIAPAGAGGAVSVFSTNDTDLIIDINGYFARPGSGGLDLFTVAPCRILDTRNPSGSAPFTGRLQTNAEASNCLPVSGAQVFVLNATVVPSGALGYLSFWPDEEPQPLVSTLNAPDGAITSNMAIVRTTSGSIGAFASDPTWLIYDLLGYFAP